MTSKQENKGDQVLPTKAASFPVKEGFQKAAIDFLKKTLEQDCYDALLIPVNVPGSNSYAWVLAKDPNLLDEANPLPPVMTIQGGRALSDLTKHGITKLRIGAVLRPCEYRAAVELFKLKQIHLDNISLITIDCPGTVPLRDFHNNYEKSIKNYENILKTWGDDDSIRQACARCHRFSLPELDDETASTLADIHIGVLGGDADQILLIPVSLPGKEILEKMNLSLDQSVESWEAEVKKIKKKKTDTREALHKEFKQEISGLENFASVFDQCINCHNCMQVCPVCYCQQCYFDSQTQHLSPKNYLERAEKRGALRFPLDTLLFHLGRMSHMVLSCVSCGACEDACPVSIPVGKVFSWVADETQPAFDYSAGMDMGETLPLQNFLKDEFCEVETPCECGDIKSVEVKDNV
jgi:formate dehydrogenase subunit beta